MRQVEKRLNEQQRKTLVFRTPKEVIDEKDRDSQIVHSKVESAKSKRISSSVLID